MSGRTRAGLLVAALLAPVALDARPAAARAEPPAAAAAEPTWRDVAPILERACVHCHAGPLAVAGLALDTAQGARQGSSTGPVLVPGKPEESRLVKHLRGTLAPTMPFDGDPLPEAEIVRLEAWIRAGALDAPSAPAPAAAPDPADPAPAAAPAAGGAPSDPALPLRWRDVAPLLRAHCVRCHQPKGLQGPPPEGLRLDSLAALLGGERAFVLPGRPEASPLLRAVRGQAERRMPLGGPPWLADAEVARLERWVREGARDDEGRPSAVPVGRRLRLVGLLEAGDRLDGVPFEAPSGARRDERARPGARVQGRFVVGARGELVLERLERR